MIGYAGKHRRRRTHRRTAWALAPVLVVGVAAVAVTVPGARLEGTPGRPGARPRGVLARDTSPVAASPRPQPAPTRFDILAAGDLLIHTPIFERARTAGGYDFRPMFAAVRPIVRRAALAICHVETPVGDGDPASYPLFNAPEELAAAVRWTGFDACDTASNHTLDRGQDGIDRTLDALDRAGVAHTGSYRSPAAARRILIIPIQGVRIAFLAYTYGTNGIPAPHPWSVNVIDPARIRADAARARRLGADLVIVNFHWGTEYQHAPNLQQSGLARDLLLHRVVDAVIGQHVHVVQPIQEIGGRFVVYGEGNLISSQTADCCAEGTQDGIMAVLHVLASGGHARIAGVDYIPTWVEHPDYTVIPVGQRLRGLVARGDGQSFLARELRASEDRTLAVVGREPNVRPLLAPALLH